VEKAMWTGPTYLRSLLLYTQKEVKKCDFVIQKRREGRFKMRDWSNEMDEKMTSVSDEWKKEKKWKRDEMKWERKEEGEWEMTIRKGSVRDRDPQVRDSSWSPQLPATHLSLLFLFNSFLSSLQDSHLFIYIFRSWWKFFFIP